MKRNIYFLVGLLSILVLVSFSFGQVEEKGIFQNMSMKTGFGFEYFSRTIKWDKGKFSSKLKSYFFTLNTEFKLQEGLSVGAFLGYSLSNYDSMIFRNLPFSLELGVGGISGFIFGAEIEKSFFSYKDFEIGGYGQFVYYLGRKKDWDIPGLAVKGTAEGKPSWMRGLVGPVITYKGFDYFSPYFCLGFNKLWGTFKMDQTVQDLKGSEEKKISGKSLFSATFGTLYEITKAISFKGEANIMPFKDGVDLGLMIRITYSF